MSRPTSKNDLIDASNTQYNILMNLIDSISEKDINTCFSFEKSNLKQAHWQRDNNVRDVLVHLYEWHNLLLNWVKKNQSGEKASFFPEGYNWRNYGKLNQLFFNESQNVSFDKALSTFKETHKEIMNLISTFSNEELFEKNKFNWVGGTTLGSYFVSTTASHYLWAINKIKKHKKTLDN